MEYFVPFFLTFWNFVGRINGIDIEFSFPSLGKVSIAVQCFWYEPKTDSKEEEEAASRVRQMLVSSC